MNKITNKCSFVTSTKYLNIKDLILILVVFLLANSVPILGIIFFRNLTSTDPYVFQGIDITLGYILSFFVMVVFLSIYRRYRSKGGDFQRVRTLFKVEKPMPSIILMGVVMVFVAQFISLPLSALFPESYEQYISAIEMLGGYALLLTVFIAPLFEEVIFRGIILNDISKAHGALVAVVASSLFFAAIHLNLVQLGPAFLSALVLGYVYVSSGSLLAVTLIHFVNNASSYLILEVFPSFTPDNILVWINDNVLVYSIMYIVAVILYSVMIFGLVKCCRKHDLITGLKHKNSDMNLNEVQ